MLANISQTQFVIINTYTSDNEQYNTALFLNIEMKINQLTSKFPFAKVILGGDFSTIFNQTIDRWPLKTNYSVNEVHSVCLRLDLIDIWRHKNPDHLLGAINIFHNSPELISGLSLITLLTGLRKSL